MECQLMDIIQPYHMCMWLLMFVMAAGVAALISRFFSRDVEGPAHEDLRPKSETEVMHLIDKIKLERKNDQRLAGNTTVPMRPRKG